MPRKSSIPAHILFGVATLAASVAVAQDKQPKFPIATEKKLAARATNVDEVTLDKKMLDFAGQFLSSKDAQTKQLIQKLNGIYVREYEFDKPDQYSVEDLDSIRKQFGGPEWSPMVREHSAKGKGDTDVYVKLVNGEVQGMFVLDAEPKQLDVVYISGPIRPQDLSALGGNLGIPKVKSGDPSKETK
jgi:hypothetical protein